MKKKIRNGIIWTLGIVVSLILIVAIAFIVSPVPGTLVIRQMFSGGVVIKDPKTYAAAAGKVAVVNDRMYRSAFKNNTYDLYQPKADVKPVPVLIWVHGGGYVGGDKESTREFATRIAADANIAVVSMNYETAPSSHFPNQVRQLDELVRHLRNTHDNRLDLSSLFLGGDSAGAQIALQYAAIQTSGTYAENIGMQQSLHAKTIKGVISYCGPVDLRQMAGANTNNGFMAFFVRTIAWSLLGSPNWQNSPQLKQISLVSNVTKDFPATYITDGNSYSFPEQGLALQRRLRELSVPVTGLFFANSKRQITHEYQFDYSTPEAKQCYAQTLAFINGRK